jgi:hypothetical protein
MVTTEHRMTEQASLCRSASTYTGVLGTRP